MGRALYEKLGYEVVGYMQKFMLASPLAAIDD